MPTILNYVSAPAGAGKTFGLGRHAADLIARHEKLLIAQPTVKLIQQTQKQILRNTPGAKVTAIYGRKSSRKPVLPDIEAHIQNATPHEGEVLLITHEALNRLSTNNRRHWHLAIDEFPSAFVHMPVQIARTHHIITDHLDVSEELMPGISVVKVGDTSAIAALIENPTDDQNIRAFGPLLRAICDDGKLVCVSADAYNDLLTNPTTLGHVDFFSILTDDFVQGYASVTIMGANARETELFILWEKLLDIRWVEHVSLINYLQYRTHLNGPRLTLSYMFERDWSRRHAGRETDDSTILDRVAEYVETHMVGRDYLWHANTDADQELLRSRHRLASVSHGIDRTDYRAIHNVVLISALNHRPAAYKFLDLLTVSSDEAQAMIAYQTEYQTLMRCSLRDPNATAPVEVVVMSKRSAEWLAERFPGCKIQMLDHDIPGPKAAGRPVKSDKKSAADKQREYRTRKKEREAAIRAELAGTKGDA